MKFKNAGGAGPAYSNLDVSSFEGGNGTQTVYMDISVGRRGLVGAAIELNHEQAVKLRDALTVWIKKNEPKPKHSIKMVEGTSI